MIIERLEVGHFHSNCYIVGSEQTKKGMIIDPGGEAGRILETAEGLGLSIRLIVATHTHKDHVAAVSRVKEITGADYTIHEAEWINRMTPASKLSGSLRSPPEPDKLIYDGDIIGIGELRFKVLHTPGHSPGGICLQGHGVVFCGDTLFNFSIGRTDFPGGSFEQLMDSIRSKLMTLPDETEVYPGHGPKTTIAIERQWNPFLDMGL